MNGNPKLVGLVLDAFGCQYMDFFSLKIAQNKRITLPDKIMKQLNVNDGDLLMMKLGTAGKAEVKRFDSDLVKF